MIWQLVLCLLLCALPTWAEPFRVTVQLFAFPNKSLGTPLGLGKEDKPQEWTFSGTVYLYDLNGDDLRSGDLVCIGDYGGERFLEVEGNKLVWRAGKEGQRFAVLKEKTKGGQVLKRGQHPVMLQLAKGKFLGGSVEGGPAVVSQPMLWMMSRQTWGTQAARRPFDQAVFGKGGTVTATQKVELLEKAFSMGAIDAALKLTGMYEKSAFRETAPSPPSGRVRAPRPGTRTP